MNSHIRILSATLMFWLGLTAVGQAASFDCNKATTETEKAICADPELSKFDEELSLAYKNYIPTGDEIAPIPEIMAEWRKARDRCGANQTCIELVYKEWILALQQNYLIEQLSKPGSFSSEICIFTNIDGNLTPSKVYSCFDNIYNLSTPTATACHVGNNVYRVTEGNNLESWDNFELESWNSVVDFLRGYEPATITKIDSIIENFGAVHFQLGCDLYSCISVAADTPDGNYFSSPLFYFFFGINEWDPIVYPKETMFIFDADGISYPDVKFCRFLK